PRATIVALPLDKIGVEERHVIRFFLLFDGRVVAQLSLDLPKLRLAPSCYGALYDAASDGEFRCGDHPLVPRLDLPRNCHGRLHFGEAYAECVSGGLQPPPCLVLPQLVVPLDGGALFLPRQVGALDVLFEFNRLALVLVQIVDVLNGDVRPAEEATSGPPTLARDEFALTSDGDRVDEAVTANGVGKLLDVGDLTPLALVAVYVDGVDGDRAEFPTSHSSPPPDRPRGQGSSRTHHYGRECGKNQGP